MTRIIKGSLRYKSAPEVDSSIDINLEQKESEQVQFDRNVNIDEVVLFDQERQESSIMRPSAKITFLFENTYTGTTQYTPFYNNLYYKDFEQTASAANPSFVGFPQSYEFDLIRIDNDVIGYTKPDPNQIPQSHLQFINKSAFTYNWGVYLSYAYQNDYNKNLEVNAPNLSLKWTASNGIPFVISNVVVEGTNLISFKCPVRHNLNVGEFVEFVGQTGVPPIGIPGIQFYEVYSLGDGAYGSEEYIFNLINLSYVGSPFLNGVTGLCRRIIDNNNPNETRSKYYVRKHKILTYAEEALLNKAGFETNIYNTIRQYESSALTPDHETKIVTKENNQTYTVNFSRDIDILPLRDNQKRPISELYLTIVHRGYFGWFYEQNKGLQQGYEFNLPYDPNNTNPPRPDIWWQRPFSFTNIPQSSYSQNGYTFYYNNLLQTGTTIDGDFCEWNDFTQQETVLSSLYHKFRYNRNLFDNTSGVFIYQIYPLGFYYKPHHKFTIRSYSPYIETGGQTEADLVPDYAYFSKNTNSFLWRDLYTYGYIDSDGIGVDYPFLNGVHYPYNNFIFKLIPEGTNYVDISIIIEPTIDNCE